MNQQEKNEMKMGQAVADEDGIVCYFLCPDTIRDHIMVCTRKWDEPLSEGWYVNYKMATRVPEHDIPFNLPESEELISLKENVTKLTNENKHLRGVLGSVRGLIGSTKKEKEDGKKTKGKKG